MTTPLFSHIPACYFLPEPTKSPTTAYQTLQTSFLMGHASEPYWKAREALALQIQKLVSNEVLVIAHILDYWTSPFASRVRFKDFRMSWQVGPNAVGGPNTHLMILHPLPTSTEKARLAFLNLQAPSQTRSVPLRGAMTPALNPTMALCKGKNVALYDPKGKMGRYEKRNDAPLLYKSNHQLNPTASFISTPSQSQITAMTLENDSSIFIGTSIGSVVRICADHTMQVIKKKKDNAPAVLFIADIVQNLFVVVTAHSIEFYDRTTLKKENEKRKPQLTLLKACLTHSKETLAVAYADNKKGIGLALYDFREKRPWRSRICYEGIQLNAVSSLVADQDHFALVCMSPGERKWSLTLSDLSRNCISMIELQNFPPTDIFLQPAAFLTDAGRVVVFERGKTSLFCGGFAPPVVKHVRFASSTLAPVCDPDFDIETPTIFQYTRRRYLPSNPEGNGGIIPHIVFIPDRRHTMPFDHSSVVLPKTELPPLKAAPVKTNENTGDCDFDDESDSD